MRLQVFLSHSGICSRRKALEVIKNGQVDVNGDVVIEPSFDIDTKADKVFLNEKRVKTAEKVYIKLNKPLGVVCTCQDKFAKLLVTDLLPNKFKMLYPVGRLDKDTEGLLLLTNDGELTYRLTHPKFKVKKVYTALIKGVIDSSKKRKFESGIFLNGKRTAPANLKIIFSSRTKSRIGITIYEGRKRQIREMFKRIGIAVIKLKRVQEGSLKLEGLAVGQWRLLPKQEIKNLYEEVGLKFYD